MRRLLAMIVFVLAGTFFFFSYRKKDAIPPEPIKLEKPVEPGEKIKGAPYITRDENPYWDNLMQEYEAYIRRAIDQRQAPGVAVAIVKDSSILFLKGFGLRDVVKQDPVTIYSVFRLGSVSKPLTSVLTGILVDNKVLHWDDKVVKYLPDFRLKSKENTDSLTIRHILSHTSGLPYHAYTDRVDDGANIDTLIYHLRNVNLVSKPGQVYSYQNVAYSITAKIIQVITKKSFTEIMNEEVFIPLRMDHASIDFQTLIADADHARPHVYTRKKGWVPVAISSTYYNAAPAGGMNASISDMAYWLRGLTDEHGKLIQLSTKEEIFKPAVKAIARNRNFRKWKKSKGSYYALGWRVLTFKDDTLNYHGGYVNGYRSEVAIKRDEGLGICVLVNSAGPLADHAIPEFFKLYEKYRINIQRWEEVNSEKLITAKEHTP